MKKQFFGLVASFAFTAGLSEAGPDAASGAGSVLAQVQTGGPAQIDYEIHAMAWLAFLPVTGKASFQINLKPDTYKIMGKVKTTGLAGMFVNYDLALASSGYTTPTRLQTYAYTSQNSDGKKNRRVQIKYFDDRFEMVAKPRFGNLGDPAASTDQVLRTSDPVTALISFMLEPRAEGQDPCGGPIKIFDGRQLSYLYLENQGLRDVKSKAWRGKAWECYITLDKIAGYKKGEAEKDSVSGVKGPMRMWVAPLPNGASVPVRIEIRTTRLGKVTFQAARLNFTNAAQAQGM